MTNIPEIIVHAEPGLVSCFIPRTDRFWKYYGSLRTEETKEDAQQQIAYPKAVLTKQLTQFTVGEATRIQLLRICF